MPEIIIGTLRRLKAYPLTKGFWSLWVHGVQAFSPAVRRRYTGAALIEETLLGGVVGTKPLKLALGFRVWGWGLGFRV